MKDSWKGIPIENEPAGSAEPLDSSAIDNSTVIRWPKHRSPVRAPLPDAPDLVVLSHLRWDFVFQRPQHLMTRAARQRRTFFVEEPIFGDLQRASLHVTRAVFPIQRSRTLAQLATPIWGPYL